MFAKPREKLFNHQLLSVVDINRVEIDGKRFYQTPAGDRYPSVTTVLSSLSKSGIAEWRESVGEEKAQKVLRQASNRGTATHSICEKYLLNEEGYLRGAMPSNIALFKQIQPYIDAHVGKVYGIEIPLYSNILRSAGTCDLFCQLHSINAVVDFKTSTRPKEEKYIESYFLQATTYAIMIEELYDIKVPSLGILIAVEDGDFQFFIKNTSSYREQVKTLFNDYHNAQQ